MDFTGPLTIFIWLSAIAIGALGFSKTRREGEDLMARAMRLMFGLMLALSVWVVSSYLLWLAGIDLKIGTISDGKMEENWWLPFATVAWTCLTFRNLKGRS